MSPPLPTPGESRLRRPLPPPSLAQTSPAPPSPTASYSDREDGQLGKKRKTPSSMQCGGRDDYSWDRHTNHACPHDTPSGQGQVGGIASGEGGVDGSGQQTQVKSPFQRKNGKWVLPYYRSRSRSAKAGSWRKALYLRRKAALITLFLDAQTAVTNELKKGVERSSLILPEVAVFEQMLPSLETIAVGEWPMDNPGWRAGDDKVNENGGGPGALEHWRMGFEKRRRLTQGRKVVIRGGWAPEGSFEFEKKSEASNGLRTRAKDHNALMRLAVLLRNITLTTAKPSTSTTTTTVVPEDELKRSQPSRAPATSVPAKTTHISVSIPAVPRPGKEADKDVAGGMSKTNSSQGSDVASGKKKPKKKKRSVLANQSNPHHVDNYRPTRLINSPSDPLEPYPSHMNLLFPPPMRFLSTRPRTRNPGPGGQPEPIRPAEDDYICTFCEYTLFYGSEEARKRAIRARRRELKRKQTIKNRAKNVAEGKGKGNLGREEEDDWDEEEDGEGGGGGGGGGGCHGRCSCGRPLSGNKSRVKKPPDPNGDDHDHDHHDHHGHDHAHSHDHEHHDHSHEHTHQPHDHPHSQDNHSHTHNHPMPNPTGS